MATSPLSPCGSTHGSPKNAENGARLEKGAVARTGLPFFPLPTP